MAKWCFRDDNTVKWFINLCSQSEIDVEKMNSVYHLRAFYFGEYVFDFYPKSLKVKTYSSEKYYQLNNNMWKDQMSSIIQLIQLGESFISILENKQKQ